MKQITKAILMAAVVIAIFMVSTQTTNKAEAEPVFRYKPVRGIKNQIIAQEPKLEPEPELEKKPRTYKGITEGDIITGELTHYCVCMKCCGKIDGITASGLKIESDKEPEIPVAACNWLPFGTIIRIEGKAHVIADRGGSSLNKIGRLDIFTPEGHQAALELGRIQGAKIEIVSLPEIREEEQSCD